MENWTSERQIICDLIKSRSENYRGGPILYRKHAINFPYGGEAHTCIIGSSGTGKTSRISIPLIRNLIENRESIVCVDPKGDLLEKCECFLTDEYELHVVDFTKPYRSTKWNPLSLIVKLLQSNDREKQYLGEQALRQQAENFFPDPTGNTDAFWNLTSRDIYTGTVLFLAQNCCAEDITLEAVFHFINDGDQRYTGAGSYLKVLMEEEEDAPWKQYLSAFVYSPNDTRASLLSVFLSGLAKYSNNPLLSSDELQVDQLRGDKLYAIFICIPDQTAVYNQISGLLANQILNQFLTIADCSCSKQLPIRVNFLLEEFGNISRAFPEIDQQISAVRSRGLRLFIFLQNYSQLEHVYGKYKSETIVSNCGVTIAFRNNHIETMKQLSERVGLQIDGRTGLKEPLISATDIGKLDIGQALIFMNGGRTKFVTKLPLYTESYDYSNWIAPKKQQKPDYIVKRSIFDIKKRAQELQDDKINRMFVSVNTQPKRFIIDSIEKELDRRIKELETENNKNSELLTKCDPLTGGLKSESLDENNPF